MAFCAKVDHGRPRQSQVSEGYQWVIRGLSEGYQFAMGPIRSGIPDRYPDLWFLVGGLSGGYQWVTTMGQQWATMGQQWATMGQQWATMDNNGQQ